MEKTAIEKFVERLETEELSQEKAREKLLNKIFCEYQKKQEFQHTCQINLSKYIGWYIKAGGKSFVKKLKKILDKKYVISFLYTSTYSEVEIDHSELYCFIRKLSSIS